MQQIIYKSNERGEKNTGWLHSRFTFSFSSYYAPTRNGFGLLKVFNDDVVQPGTGFGLHAHTNMEIISILLQGRMNHKDTLGYSEELEAGAVQIMSAGSGLRHEEYNIGETEVRFLQIWIEPRLQNIPPRYQRRSFPQPQRHNRLVTVVSNEEGPGHCWINQNARLSLGSFDAHMEQHYPLNPMNKGLFLYVIDGSLQAGGVTLEAGDAAGFWETDSLHIRTTSAAHYLLIETPINHL
ncbi:MAG: pirin family protein [Lacibacter sp.]